MKLLTAMQGCLTKNSSGLPSAAAEFGVRLLQILPVYFEKEVLTFSSRDVASASISGEPLFLASHK